MAEAEAVGHFGGDAGDGGCGGAAVFAVVAVDVDGAGEVADGFG